MSRRFSRETKLPSMPGAYTRSEVNRKKKKSGKFCVILSNVSTWRHNSFLVPRSQVISSVVEKRLATFRRSWDSNPTSKRKNSRPPQDHGIKLEQRTHNKPCQDATKVKTNSNPMFFQGECQGGAIHSPT